MHKTDTIVRMSLVLTALLGLAAQTPAIEPDLDIVLGTARLSPKTARFDPNILRLFRQGEFGTPLYDSIFENPWRAPIFAENLKRELALSGEKPQDSIASAMRLMGVQTRRALVGNPNQSIEESSKQPGALKALFEDWKSKGWVAGTIPSVDRLPKEVQSAAALVISAIPKALEYRQLAFSEIADLDGAYDRFCRPSRTPNESVDWDWRRKIGQKTDLAYLSAGAFDLAMAIKEASARLASVLGTAKFEFRLATKFGEVVLSGGSDVVYDATPLLLAIDTGGNDTYLNQPSNRNSRNGLSVVLDSEGNDKYLSDQALASQSVEGWGKRRENGLAPGPVGALFGYAMLIDQKGTDLYRTHSPGIGSSRFGCSMLVEVQGDDVYDAYADSIAYANFGVAIVDDSEGKDRYTGFSQVQACGQTMGSAMLVDRAGDDAYVANDSVLDFVSAQSTEHNSNMSQGVGNGRRGDYVDGHSQAGGIGVLYDLSGNDSYTCGIFGQGAGYWMGVGMLLDGAGADRYKGQWYVQGAAAHYAVGYLEDESGNDIYEAPLNMAMGAGHDFSFGALIDRVGDDQYSAPNLSLGAGNANGIGWLLDGSGADRYTSSGITLGSAAEAPRSSLRIRALCLGVFMDLGGDDVYPGVATWAKNASRSAQVQNRGPAPEESQLGVFWDR